MTGEVGTETLTTTVKTLGRMQSETGWEKKSHVTYVCICVHPCTL